MNNWLEYGGGCMELTNAIPALRAAECCGSCHSEWEDDYGEPSSIEHDGKVYGVCCGMRIAYEEVMAGKPVSRPAWPTPAGGTEP